MGFVTLPTIWLYQVMFAAVSPFAEVAVLLGLLGGNGGSVLAYYGAFFSLELITAAFAYFLEREKHLRLHLLVLQRLFYPRLMLYVVAKSLYMAVAGRPMGWGVNVRHASVEIATATHSRV